MEHQFKTHKKHKTDVCDGDWFDKVSRFTTEQKMKAIKAFWINLNKKGKTSLVQLFICLLVIFKNDLRMGRHKVVSPENAVDKGKHQIHSNEFPLQSFFPHTYRVVCVAMIFKKSITLRFWWLWLEFALIWWMMRFYSQIII